MKYRKTVWVVIFMVLGLVLLVGLLIFSQQGGLENGNISPSPSPTTTTQQPTQMPNDRVEIPDDWESYTSGENGFSIQHPPDMEIEEDRPLNSVRFIKFGPTQTEETEVFDAISLSLNLGSTDEMSLMEFVEMRYTDAENEPVTENVSEIEDVTIAGYAGYRFTVVSLGEFEHIYLPAGNGEYLRIINGTVDPTDQGFDETVDMMLSTLQIE